MKKIFPVLQLIYISAFSAIVFAACKKTKTITVQEPVAAFSVLIKDPFDNWTRISTTTYIDSTFTFQNTSDSGANIAYRWEFGDGATSTDKNPKHKYAKRGSYKVTLIVSNDNRAFDTLQQTVSV